MNDNHIPDIPEIHSEIKDKSDEIGFTMPSDILIGTLLKTLISSKPGGNFLELGTGIGLSLSWMVDGMDRESRLISIDNDPGLVSIAQGYFEKDDRVRLIMADGADWIKKYKAAKFDLVFADAWPGKYSELAETLDLVQVGGFYVVDDMIAQPNWPDGHQAHVDRFIDYLENRNDFTLTKMNWSTGLVIAVRNRI